MTFTQRHVGPDSDDLARMLAVVGYPDLAALMSAAIPAEVRSSGMDLPPALSEAEALARLREFAAMNTVTVSMLGQGYHDTITPAVIRRCVLEAPAWYTSYTPYQAEISQGRLEALLIFQTLIEDLMGLPVAGASLLDEATAVTEAVALMRRAAKGRDGVIALDIGCLPQTRALVLARAAAVGTRIVEFDPLNPHDIVDLLGVVLQHPAADGHVRDLTPAINWAHDRAALVTMAMDPLASVVLPPPGELGADIAVGSAQRFGVPLFFGGPHPAFIAVCAGLERQLPGRLVGVSRDAEGNVAFRLATQTREQHIRREKATSNICTAQALLAVVAAMFSVHHGPEGLAAIAERTHLRATAVAEGLREAGIGLAHDSFFDTIVGVVPGRADDVVAAAAESGIDVRRLDPDRVLVACDETTTPQDVSAVVSAFTAVSMGARPAGSTATLPQRTSTFMTHPYFHRYRSEVSLTRFLRELSDKDLALDRTMIPLGSCTMKLNAVAELEAISWPEFAAIHPHAPASRSIGYRALISDLQAWLADITGYAAVSVQPNAGSAGELAGLMAIRGYYRDRGEDRDVCLIPTSAHGTNAASAMLAGLRVVPVATGADGVIDADAMDAALDRHAGRVAAIMITYPSTHGVYERGIVELCRRVHAAGAQVYIDGANLNALMGYAKFGEFGGDVSHLNLHKTFCIPHGGGGPGVGPVAVAAHLVDYLPSDPLGVTNPVRPPAAAARYGSAGILPIAYAYIAMSGADGLRRSTEVAVLAANYLAVRLRPAYEVLFTGPAGLVAHECILDIRPLTAASGVSAEDIAKRLIDFGFHAPTMSFPVPGTLMVEPTESENLEELERFCSAMLAIRAEIDEVIAGVPVAQSPLRRAPHTLDATLAPEWDRPYSRRQAARPDGKVRSYWPPVARIDNAYGDRNLVCACPPIEEEDG